jgi:aryl-alcohol dehydrogenase
VYKAHLVADIEEGLFPFDKLLSFYDFNELDKGLDHLETGTVIKPVFLV